MLHTLRGVGRPWQAITAVGFTCSSKAATQASHHVIQATCPRSLRGG